jgi:hypothetical protein
VGVWRGWGGHTDGMGWKPAGPPHPDPLPLGGGEEESSPAIGLPPVPRRGREGRGKGENGGGDKIGPYWAGMRAEMVWGRSRQPLICYTVRMKMRLPTGSRWNLAR